MGMRRAATIPAQLPLQTRIHLKNHLVLQILMNNPPWSSGPQQSLWGLLKKNKNLPGVEGVRQKRAKVFSALFVFYLAQENEFHHFPNL